MKTNVADTSIETYHDLARVGALTAQQSKVIAAMRRDRDYSLQELVRATSFPVNVISGRVNELKTERVLEHGPTRACSITGRTIHPVRLAQRAAPMPKTQPGLF